MNQHMRQLTVSHIPAAKVPITTQEMWEVAAADYDREAMALDLAKTVPDMPAEIIARRERTLRTRRAICNAIDFLISNAADIAAVMASKGKRR